MKTVVTLDPETVATKKHQHLSATQQMLANLTPDERESIKDVRKRFKTKISPYLGTLTKSSPAIAKQFIPDSRESIDFEGQTDAPFEEGRENGGIYGLERVYSDRAVLTPYFECAAYCRYCFKKTRTLAGEPKRMSDEDIDRAIHYIQKDPRIKTALITGGDPFLDHKLLKQVLDKLHAIPHVRYIRVGTRNILFEPQKITDDLAEMLSQYNRVNPRNLKESKSLAVGLSLNHIDELTPEVIEATQKMIKRGILIKGQTVLMKDINDTPEVMQELMEGFLSCGIVPYYLLHCMPVVGSKHLRTSVQKGIDILRELSVRSGSFAPLYVYVSPVGKHRLGINSKLEHVELNGQRYVRTKTPYKARDFLEFTGKSKLPYLHETSADGFIISHYLDELEEG